MPKGGDEAVACWVLSLEIGGFSQESNICRQQGPRPYMSRIL